MMKCENCGNEQSTGKFCGKCGSPLVESIEQKEIENESVAKEESAERKTEEGAASVEDVEVEDGEGVDVTEASETADESVEGDSEQGEIGDENKSEQAVQDNETPSDLTEGKSEQTEELADEETERQSQELAAGQEEQAATASTVQETEGHTGANNAQHRSETASETYDQTAEVKEHIQNYWGFLMRLLKNPTKSFNLEEDSFNFSLINYLLLSFSYGIVFVYIMKNTVGLVSFEELPYMRIFFSMFVFSAIVSLSSIFGIYLISKIYDSATNFKIIITKHGGLITPVIALQIGTILFALGGSFGLTLVFLLFSILFAYLLFPSLLIFQYSKKHNNDQRVYLAAAVTLLNSVFIYIIIRIVAQSLITEVFNEFSGLFRIFKGF